MEIVKKLADEIGVRYGGSEKEEQAARFVYQYLQNKGLEVEQQKIQVLGWEQISPPQAEILLPKPCKLSCAPFMYSGSTKNQGITGRLIKVGKFFLTPGSFEWIKYALLSPDDQYKSYLVARPDGPPIPVPNHGIHFPYSAPTVVIGAEEAETLNQLLTTPQEVVCKIKTESRYLEACFIKNIIATLHGYLSKTVIISAHHDSPFGSPGAVDNASGVEALLRVTEYLAGTKPKYTLKFISFGGEEPYLYGSRYFVRDLKEKEKLQDIVLNINLDCVAQEKNIKIYCGPEDLRKNVQKLFDVHSCFGGKKVQYGPPQRIADDYAFSEEGIATVLFFYWPYPQYHLPTDNPQIVSEKSMQDTVKTVMLILDNLDRLFS